MKVNIICSLLISVSIFKAKWSVLNRKWKYCIGAALVIRMFMVGHKSVDFAVSRSHRAKQKLLSKTLNEFWSRESCKKPFITLRRMTPNGEHTSVCVCAHRVSGLPVEKCSTMLISFRTFPDKHGEEVASEDCEMREQLEEEKKAWGESNGRDGLLIQVQVAQCHLPFVCSWQTCQLSHVLLLQKWTPELDRFLKEGVRQHGAGKWARILLDYDFEGRTGTMLKDRWRTLTKGRVKILC